ncbi:hypothetical protein LTR62_004863 [Meristemomyces frigidus]|uniref:DUF8004 domain-containing protein n=1 Tax=Meristemomyces frigidus TaxID=1508187 RepID=A0AAN7TEU0_9PEZI|nr:hypothetical protein LTR62_004863 [Meristemomyces frigidus]
MGHHEQSSTLAGSASLASQRHDSVRHFDGAKKASSEWDGLRKDTKLWFDDGDCLVHLYTLGGSQRGPSLRLRYCDIDALRCEYLQDRCLHVVESPTSPKTDHADAIIEHDISHNGTTDLHRYDLYIPAPANLTRDQAFAYHLTTRNFFAYATRLPIVGESLGDALADLLRRVRVWQPKTAALANFTSYCEAQGYMDMADNPDHALACLLLAEEARLKELWVEAFVHCVGMRDRLRRSPEHHRLSNTTKALIDRASLEMDLHISRVTRAVGCFLEEELGPEYLGLSQPARLHLDRFRSFLHNYYVDKLGYFPPDQESAFNKRLWTKMYHAFQTLYVYLVDNDAKPDAVDGRLMTGGICVVQNVEAFDARHGYTPLPHPLPLLPEAPADQPRGLRSFKLGRAGSNRDQQATARATLEKATNRVVQDVMQNELVAEYQWFERKRLEEKLSPAEARKVRWLLIYGVLQMLISITRAPQEVRDTEGPSYPLCVLTEGGPSWLSDAAVEVHRPTKLPVATTATLQPPTVEDIEDRISIHPDCEADNAEDYFSSQSWNTSRRASTQSLDMAPAPLRINTQLSGSTTSIRSSVHSSVNALQRSFIGTLSRRGSIRALGVPPSQTPPRRVSSASFCHIMIEGYGNGADPGSDVVRRASLTSLCSQPEPQTPDLASLAAFDFGLTDVSEESTPDEEEEDLETGVFPCTATSSHTELWNEGLGRSNSDSSTSSTSTSTTSASNHSLHSNTYDSPSTEISSCWDSDGSKRNSEVQFGDSTALPVIYESSIETTRSSCKQYAQKPDQNPRRRSSGSIGVTAGCYTPSGRVTAGCYAPSGAAEARPLVSPSS